MTPSLPDDRPASPSSGPPRPATTSWSVGWALSAITCAVLVVGVAIIHLLSADPPSTDTAAGPEVKISPKDPTEQETPARLVLRPEDSDSASTNSPKSGAAVFSRGASPAAWNAPAMSDDNEVLPAYR